MTSLKLGFRWTPRFTSWASLVLGAIFVACVSCSPTGSTCASAGGTCLLGGSMCAKQAAQSAQDCNTNPPNPGGGFCCLQVEQAGLACGADADCGSEGVCGFPASAGCSATGTCFPKASVVCEAFELGCACDGTSLNLICNGLPSGYTTAPLAHTGACALDSGIGE